MLKLAPVSEVNMALNGSTDCVLCTNHYQTFLQRLPKLTVHIDMYDIQLHLQNVTRASNIWLAGRSLDTPGPDLLCSFHV